MEPGDVVAERFVVERLAGTGGMGAVYRALDLLSGQPVALKVLRDQTQQYGDRFLREARVLAELHSPGVVRYVAHGVAATGARYLAMEWLDGEDLAERLGRAGLTPAESLVLVERVAQALAAAHARGIVHRDLKPRNLFLPGGAVARIKLLDFGVARWGDAREALTHTGVAVGTPGYMAPEQARGERDLTPSADVFALGCVWYECLSGRPAYVGENLMALLARILLQPPPRLRDVRPDVPDDIDALLARMLARDPTERPADGAALVAALAALRALDDSRPSLPSPARAPITTGEQRLLSVVAAATGPAYARTVTTTLPANLSDPLGPDVTALADLAAVVDAYRGRLYCLADGSVVAVLAGTGAATDQADQAARCALAMRAVLADVPMALATGRGLVGSHRPVGDAIDRAASLVAAAGALKFPAGPRPVLLDELTAGLLDERFDVRESLGHLVLAGWRARPAAARTLLGRPTPFVGRERELATLDGALAECVGDGVARVVLVTAPAGMGKSRLRHEWLARVRAREGAPDVLLGRADAVAAGAPFGLVGQCLRAACGAQDGEPLVVRQQKLRARIGRHTDDAASRVTLFLGELLGAPFPAEQSVQLRAAREDPRLMGDQLRRAWEDWLDAETAAHPLLLVLEDLHWGDLPSVTLVDAALRTLRDRPLMVLALARPEVHDLFPELFRARDLQELRLGELTRRAAERLVRSVLGEGIAGDRVGRLVAQAGGNAFYLEELIRATAGTAEGSPHPAGEVAPGTVLAMVEARLRAMEPEARQILRAASVFGRVFWRGGVEALLGAEGPRLLADWIDELLRREVFDRRDAPRFGGEEIVFRHDLLRDAAYAMLPDADRVQGHRRAAAWLEAAGERDARVLAEHLERGGDAPQAAACYVRAAEQALEGHDLAAALARADRSLACGVAGEALGVVRALQAQAHKWRGEWEAAAEAGAEALRWLPRQDTRWYVAAGDYAVASGSLGDQARLDGLAAELTEPAPPGVRREVRRTAVARLAVQFLVTGRPDAAARLFDLLAAAPGVTPAGDAPVATAAEHEAHAFHAMCVGDPAGCWRWMEAAAQVYREAGNLRSVAVAQMNAGFACTSLGAWEQAEVMLRSTIATAERLDLPAVASDGRQNLALALTGAARYAEARAEIARALTEYRSRGRGRMEGISHVYLAEILARTGELDAAEEAVRAAVTLLADNPPHRAHALATLARILLRRGGEEAAALGAAREAQAALDALGGTMMEGEGLVRLVHAEALAATGQREAAAGVLAVARERLRAKAAQISDPAWRRSFLERVPENAETLRLAQEFLGGEEPTGASGRGPVRL